MVENILVTGLMVNSTERVYLFQGALNVNKVNGVMDKGIDGLYSIMRVLLWIRLNRGWHRLNKNIFQLLIYR
jgi:hypothetical protein